MRKVSKKISLLNKYKFVSVFISVFQQYIYTYIYILTSLKLKHWIFDSALYSLIIF